MVVRPSRASPTASFGAVEPKRRLHKPRSREKPATVVSMGDNPPPDNWMTLLMDEEVERSQKLWDTPRQYFRGSGAGNECVRSMTFEAMGHRVPFEARVSRIFSTGNAIESVLVKTAKRAKIFVVNSDQLEGKIKDPLIICHIDLIVKNPTSEEEFLGEIKSIKLENFKKLAKEHGPLLAGQSPLLKSHPGYIMQWNTYAWTPEINLEYGFILFENKNTQHQKVYWLIRDPELHKKVLARHNEALPYIMSDPQRVAPIPEGLDPVMGEGVCRWCDHRYLCKRVDKGGAEYDDVRAIDAKLRG